MPTIPVPYKGCLLCDGETPIDIGDSVNVTIDSDKFSGFSNPIVGRLVLIACPGPNDPSDAEKVYHIWLEPEDLPESVTTLHPSDITAITCVSCCEQIQADLDAEKIKIAAAEAAITALQGIAGLFSRATPGVYNEAGNQIIIPIEDQDGVATGETITLNFSDEDTTYSIVNNVLISSAGPTFPVVVVSSDANNLISAGTDLGAFLPSTITDAVTFSNTVTFDGAIIGNGAVTHNGAVSLALTLTVASDATFSSGVEIDGALDHDGATVGLYGEAPVAQAAAIADVSAISITDPADSPATADALRDDLVANALAEIRQDLTDIRANQNSILAALRGIGIIAT